MKGDLVLVDTTVWVHYLRGGNPEVKDRIVPLILENRLATADIIIMELLRGVNSEKNFQILHDDLVALPRLVMDAATWKLAWKSGYQLRKAGVNVPLADTLIAVIAVQYGCVLLHSDQHFSMLSDTLELRQEMLIPRQTQSE
ncbi:PIN domain-containing protein [Desulfonatronospira sp.]|uniref:type II toxin-antitoxin system VapC family toxin n=1 Tax=Desulfonatronospira sp. TaxID=1962951 RepID=UPI0025BC8FF3|nr:PIN domain-containing protein [Desulfonatronospira sp.]